MSARSSTVENSVTSSVHADSAVRAPVFHATRNPGAGQDFTGLAAVVQLRLRVAIGSQTLTVKSRLLTGENSVRIRGDPPAFARSIARARLPRRSAA